METRTLIIALMLAVLLLCIIAVLRVKNMSSEGKATLFGVFGIIGVMVAVIGILLSQTATTSSPAPNTPPSNGDLSLSNADLLKTAVTNMKLLKSYHIDLTVAYDGNNYTQGGDIDVANKNIDLAGTASGKDYIPVENIYSVFVDGNIYVSSDGGKSFTKTGSNTTSDKVVWFKMWNGFSPTDINKVAGALKDGDPVTMQIDGVDTKHINGNAQDLQPLISSVSASTYVGITLTGTVDIWISTDTYPTVRVIKVSGNDVFGDRSLDATFRWSKLNENFDISAPTNVTTGGN